MNFRWHGAAAFVVWSLGVVSADGMDIGAAAGPVTLTTLSGDPLVMSNYGERPATVVLFLSSRCEVTDHMSVAIDQLHQRNRLSNVLFVGIAPNGAESADEVREFAQRRGMIFPVYRDPGGTVARHFGACATPEAFLLNGQGTLVFHGGLHDDAARKALEAAIDSLLRKQPMVATSYAVKGTSLERPAPPRQINDPYGVISFSSELIFEKIPSAAAHHCSTICEAGNGDLVCVWYGGSYESADDQVLFLAQETSGQELEHASRACTQFAAATGQCCRFSRHWPSIVDRLGQDGK